MTSTQSLSHLDSPKIWGKKLTYIKNILFRNTDVKVSRESVACLSAQVLGEQKQLDSLRVQGKPGLTVSPKTGRDT